MGNNEFIVNGTANFSLDDEFWIGTGPDYIKIYDYGGLGVPIVKGQSSLAGSSFNVEDGLAILNVTKSPMITFVRSDFGDNAVIEYQHPTDLLYFSSATGGYGFDGNIIGSEDICISGGYCLSTSVPYTGATNNVDLGANNFAISQNQKICFDGDTCAHFLSYNGTCIQNGSTCIA